MLRSIAISLFLFTLGVWAQSSGVNPTLIRGTAVVQNSTSSQILTQPPGTSVGVAASVAATSTANQNSPAFSISGNYWTGSGSAVDTWSCVDTLGSGANPTSTLSCTHTGSTGSSMIQFSTINVTTGYDVNGTALASTNLSDTSNIARISAANVFSNTNYFNGGIVYAIFTVATLPLPSALGAGAMVSVSDASTYTPGTCTGGGTDYMIAISNGTSWSCH